eukprot:scaffold5715_cov166-Amphora_coffeaeformis.AAC.6
MSTPRTTGFTLFGLKLEGLIDPTMVGHIGRVHDLEIGTGALVTRLPRLALTFLGAVPSRHDLVMISKLPRRLTKGGSLSMAWGKCGRNRS